MSQRFDEQDYVLGTHDEEMVRLGLQHRVWRPRATDAWRRAGFTVGQTLLDLGCGPGYASIDLAEIVGPRGQIVAVERSARDLDALRASARRNGLTNIVTHQLDLDTEALPEVSRTEPLSKPGECCATRHGLRRLVDIGEMAAERAGEIRNEFVACESAPHARMITPGMLEIIARKN